ncbi:prepilin-type N-terminal cleavage/methylation domain-containing protein [Thiocapsa sp.]|uniref:type IV pilus modification PilV family protein n=1 Tax=Thiocapsa sp. TaxID=2024551 RepID=UPI001BD0077F|nr:prepilin-type N-terminal cleavage/methylation domain-containing protein [Thiocapsa sp.]
MSDRLVRLRIPKLADPPRPIRVKGRDTGATLIEALIAMIVISIGLLGIAALQTKALNQPPIAKRRRSKPSEPLILVNGSGQSRVDWPRP